MPQCSAAPNAGPRGSPNRALRNRIEHVEAPDAADIARFGTLGVMARPQAFALRSLLDTHATVAFGTDWPVVQLNPLLGIRNAVLRQSLDGQPHDGYLPAQRITVGKLADLVVFSKNFMEGRSQEIADAQVNLTIVDGKIVYEGN